MAQKDRLIVSPAEPQRRSKLLSQSPTTSSLIKSTSSKELKGTVVRPMSRSRKKIEEKDGTNVNDNDIFLLPIIDYKIMIMLTALAVAVRLFRIYQPSSVVFDEVHFGGFTSKYIKGRFFMDVHPPLAKMLITLAGWLAGFNGNFDFKEIGKDYVAPGVPYVAMRMVSAICGIAVVPTMFLTLKAAGCATASATLAAGLILFDNALATQSRFILLDAPLIFFTSLTGLAWTCFLNIYEQGHSQSFSLNWWFWLAITGLGLGATASTKWVGLLTIAWVGGLTVLQLWVLLGDTKNVTPRLWFKHFFARVICLIGIPLAFYIGMFAIHFAILVNPGEGDGFMSSEFQSTLNSKKMNDVPADVAFGSRVTIRHVNTQGGYLHSHASMYPTGSKQQQITLYPHKDENNMWVFENQTYPKGGVGLSGFNEISPPVFIQDRAIVKLYHTSTDKRLHSHEHRPPVTEAEWQNEVTGYGYKGFTGDANDLFRIEIVKKMSHGAVAKERIRTIETKFRLIHILSGCALFSHKVKLPTWGFEQQEVTCAKGGTLPNSLWYVESNEHPQLGPSAERVNYRRPGFFGKFWELQRIMWKTNAGLIDSHNWDSRPSSWPFLLRGINFWSRDHRQVYLFGNPVVWWSSTVAIGLYALFKVLSILRWQRGYRDYSTTNFRRFDYEIGVTALGWVTHYIPFFLMQRQLFLHHYLPALYFAIIVFCQIFDFFAFRIRFFGLRSTPIIGWVLAIIFLTLSAITFSIYSPLVYGNPWTVNSCRQATLLKSWDWDCNTFLDNYSDYNHMVFPATSAAPTAPTAAPAGPPVPHVQKQPEKPKEDRPPKEAITQAAIPPLNPDKSPNDIRIQEEHVEYRDQDGNILNDEEVKALEGSAHFETKYETRYRVLDQYGNEIESDASPPEEKIAGQYVDGVESDTAGVDKDENTVPNENQDENAETVWVKPPEAEPSPEDQPSEQVTEGETEVKTVVIEVDEDDPRLLQQMQNGPDENEEMVQTVYVDGHGNEVEVDEEGIPLVNEDEEEDRSIPEAAEATTSEL